MKARINDLAIFGGTPAFQEKLHVGRPNIGNRQHFLDRINDMLDSHWLTNRGPYVQEFEKHLAEFLGVKHCIAMCNGTVALEIAIRALGMRGEVILPSFTFIATAHALQWQEITPVFCDIDPRTHTLDPRRVEEMVTPRTSGILGVHLWGRACEVEALSEVAHRYNLKLLFDAAHAFACTYKGRMVGNFGDAEVFSFHATKFFNTFEGGAVATNHDELAAKIRLMKNFGFAGYDDVIYIGTNGKMSEISAVMGLTNLEHLDEFITVNRRNYECYVAFLEGLEGIKVLRYEGREKHNYNYIVLEVDEEIAGIHRDDLHRVLWTENILSRRYFYPGCHRMEPYRSYFPHAHLLLSETEKLNQRILTLPTGTQVGSSQIEVICSIIRTAVSHAPQVRERLRTMEPN